MSIDTTIDHQDVVQLFSKMERSGDRFIFRGRVILADGTTHDIDSETLEHLAWAIRRDSTRSMKRFFTGQWDHEYKVTQRPVAPSLEPVPSPEPVLAQVDIRPLTGQATDRLPYIPVKPRRRNPITGHFIGGGRGER